MDPITIGETAGRIWQHLSRVGSISTNDLPKQVGVDSKIAYAALGWLCREDKLSFEKSAKDVLVRLKSSDLAHVQA